MKKIFGILLCLIICIFMMEMFGLKDTKRADPDIPRYDNLFFQTENQAVQDITEEEDGNFILSDFIRVLLTNHSGGYYWSADEIIEDKELSNYPGEIYIISGDSGYLVINRLPLEEYLIYVTASEMPSSFEMEALKAQAICARTYAVRQIKDGSMKDYYADVDDTSAFQVYSNQNYNERVKQAVEETAGIILTYENEPIEAFYYSCSGGVGTTPCVWANSEDTSEYPYFQSKIYGSLEEESPWYRWSYYAPSIDFACMKEKILWKYNNLKDKVKVYDKNESSLTEVSAKQLLNSDYIVQDMVIEEYEDNAYACVLAIFCDSFTIRIYGENNIRYVLADSSNTLICQDGSKHQLDLLPSGYFQLYCSHSKDEENNSQLLGIRINGGGFGHGIGLSQYGAHYLAESGKNYRDILTYYYQNVSLRLMKNDAA